jgi:cbb3-type cytochrome oxidase maturation protein
MSAIYIMLPVTLLLALAFLIAYIWSVRSGQFEDTETPAMRILPDDKLLSPKQSMSETKQENKPS